MTADSEQIATAWHEAGHAVVALALGRPIQRVSIEPNAIRQGVCQVRKGTFKPSRDGLETEVLILLGGLAAEARQMGRYAWASAYQDLRMVREMTLGRAGGEQKAERLERRLLDKTEHLLDKPGMWLAVTRIAEALLKTPVISGREARHLFDLAVARESA